MFFLFHQLIGWVGIPPPGSTVDGNQKSQTFTTWDGAKAKTLKIMGFQLLPSTIRILSLGQRGQPIFFREKFPRGSHVSNDRIRMTSIIKINKTWRQKNGGWSWKCIIYCIIIKIQEYSKIEVLQILHSRQNLGTWKNCFNFYWITSLKFQSQRGWKSGLSRRSNLSERGKGEFPSQTWE